MRICVLASGSKGNSTYVETEKHKILFDMGTNVRYIKERLEELSVSLNDIDTIIISHIHSDHIGALENYIKKYSGNVYMTMGMIGELDSNNPISKYEHLVIFDDDIYLDNIRIEVIKTSHDTKDSKGYILYEENNSVVYLTDTGYLNQKYFSKLRNKTVYLFESNHDVEMLLNGKYPPWLKDRVVGPYGHLSNKDASIYLAKLIGEDTKKVVLLHLSHENNTEEKAMDTIKSIFLEYGVDFDNISCAKQNEKSEIIEL